MTARPLWAALILASALAAGCAGDQGAQPVQVLERFEEDLTPWEKDADVPDDPNRPGEKVEWSIELSDEEATSGERSARLAIDGSQDDGTIWIVRGIQVSPAASYEATVQVQAWSQSESFNHITDLVLYLGAQAPTAEDDFPRSENGSAGTTPDGQAAGIREPLHQTEGWQAYGFDWITPGDAERLYVAVGISVVWETQVHHFVDDLSVDLQPQATGDAGGGGGSPY